MGRRHDNRVLAASTAGLGLFLYFGPSTTVVLRPLGRLLGIRYQTSSGRGVALTFDDGPHPDGTARILELLARAGATAAFFLVGEQVERHPALAREIVAAGHEIGVHCRRHRSALRLTPRLVRDDLDAAEATIAEVTGVTPRYYRPPYGVLTTPALAHARRRGWETVLWAREGHDWEARATPRSIAARLTRRVTAGDVLLLHDADHYSVPGAWRNTLGALPLVLEELERRGLEPAPLA